MLIGNTNRCSGTPSEIPTMVLELHIYGPAFSLPSIDAQCLAAVAYLNQAVPRHEWALVAGCDSPASPISSGTSGLT